MLIPYIHNVKQIILNMFITINKKYDELRKPKRFVIATIVILTPTYTLLFGTNVLQIRLCSSLLLGIIVIRSMYLNNWYVDDVN